MKDILKRSEVATMLKMPLRTIDYLVSTNQIPFSRLGKRSVRFSKARLEEWFSEREGIAFKHKSSDK